VTVRTRYEGPDLEEDRRQLEVRSRGMKKVQAVLALVDAVDAGTLALQDFLEKAYTNTGIHREAYRGGLPGRHDTGEMVGSISNDTEHAPNYDGEQDGHGIRLVRRRIPAVLHRAGPRVREHSGANARAMPRSSALTG
jgi:hypothetical protein